MSNKRTEAQNRLNQLATRNKAVTTAEPASSAPPASGAEEVRTRPVRMSVDWWPADHRRIRQVCDEVAAVAGRASIPSSDLVRAAVGLVLDDPNLREQLQEHVVAGQGRL